MPQVRTTISCRLFAQLAFTVGAAILALASTNVPAATLWTVRLGGPPAASPLIAADRVYVALQSGTVAAHSLKDGAELWHREVRADFSLAVDAGRLVTASSAGLAAINADGAPAWQVDVTGQTAPPLAQDGWIVAASSTELLALRAADGSVVWRIPSAAQRERASIEGDTAYVPFDDGRVRALDLRTGRERWTRRLGGPATEVLPFPDRVFVGSADKYLYCLDAADGAIAWRTRVGAAVRGKPASDGEQLFVLAFDNLLRVYDRRSGALRWSPRGVPFRPAAGPIVIGPTVFVAGPTVEVRAFDRATGKPSGQVKLPQALANVPAFAESAPGVVMAVVTGNLNQQWTLALWGPAPASTPVSASGRPSSRGRY